VKFYFSLASSVVAFTLIALLPGASAQAPGISGDNPTTSCSIDAMDSVMPKRTASARMRSKFVLFITNRSIGATAEQQARNGMVLRYENVFLNTLARPVSYGFAEISYPTTRKKSDQNYAPCSRDENPLKDFSVIDHQIVPTPEAFRDLISTYYPKRSDASLLYIHGFNNSFSDAAEELAQLALDLGYEGLPVLFSWPSDAGRTDPCRATSGISTDAYKKADAIALASRSYVADTMDQLANTLRPFKVLAHSMGTGLAMKAIILRQSKKDREDRPDDPSGAIASSPCSVVLAAPDISTKEFNVAMRPQVVRPDRHVVVYCSDDRALRASQYTNSSDERLGYCPMAKSAMDGVDFVTVTGPIEDFFHHSYYLNSAKVLEDIRQVLVCQEPPPSRAGGWRKIQLP
jgi:esterase/lipase superfamily enzyme